MANGTDSHETPDARTVDVEQLMAAMSGLTQTELARRMGTTQSSIARIEGGGSLPTLGMLARLAHATGTPLRLAAPGITDVDLGGPA